MMNFIERYIERVVWKRFCKVVDESYDLKARLKGLESQVHILEDKVQIRYSDLNEDISALKKEIEELRNANKSPSVLTEEKVEKYIPPVSVREVIIAYLKREKDPRSCSDIARHVESAYNYVNIILSQLGRQGIVKKVGHGKYQISGRY